MYYIGFIVNNQYFKIKYVKFIFFDDQQDISQMKQ
jgi:hypothetical protein